MMGLREIINADIKTYARYLAYNNIRNSLSMIAVLGYVNKRVAPECIMSTDDTSVYINEEGKVSVISSEEADKHNSAHNQGTSIVQDAKQKRVVTFNVTVSGDNKVVCKVVKFADRLFTQWSKKPKIIRIEQGLWLCLYQYGIDGVTLAKHIYAKAIIPEAIAHREQVLQKSLSGLYQPIMSSCSDNAEDLTTDVVDTVAVRARYKYMCLASDGAYDQINAMIEWLIERSERLQLDILQMKYAGGCSMVQQVNDVGKMHQILKSQYRSQAFRLGVCDQPPGEHWKALRKILENTGMTGPSFDTLWSTLCAAGRFLNKAFSESNIDSAFKKSGVIPCDPETILSSCFHYEKLPAAAKQFVLSKLPAVTDLVEAQGMVLEEDFARILGEMPNIDNCPVKRNKQINEMALSRQRCMVVSHEFVLALNQRNRVRDGVLNDTGLTVGAEEVMLGGAEEEQRDVVATSAESSGEPPAVTAITVATKRKRKSVVVGADVEVAPSVKKQCVLTLEPRAAKPRKPKAAKVYQCSVHVCWTKGEKECFNKCVIKGCDKWFCLGNACKLLFVDHMVECAKH